MTYRSRYRANFSILPVFDLLVTDSSNPHALLYQFESLRKLLQELPYRNKRKAQVPPERVIERQIRREIQSLLPPATEKAKWSSYRPRLVRLLGKLEDQLQSISSHMSDTFFVHTEFTQQIDGQWDEDPV